MMQLERHFADWGCGPIRGHLQSSQVVADAIGIMSFLPIGYPLVNIQKAIENGHL